MKRTEMVERVKKGDIQAKEELFKELYQKIYALCLGMVKNGIEVEDIVQKTFMLAFEKIQTFKGNSDFVTWLYRIAINECNMRKRELKRYYYKFLPLCGADRNIYSEYGKDYSNDIGDYYTVNHYVDDTNPEHILEKKEMGEMVKKALSLLPKYQQECIYYSDIEMVSNVDMAGRLNIGIEGYKSRLHRARENFKTVFNGIYS